MQDIDGLAALITACDLVVTVSNTTAHLAGALGKETYVLVPFGQARMWYRFHDRTDNPFYPDIKIRDRPRPITGPRHGALRGRNRQRRGG